MNFDWTIVDDSTQDFIACQEVAHTLGLGHNNDADTVPDHGSCTANDEDAYVAHVGSNDRHHLLSHDQWHLNQGY